MEVEPSLPSEGQQVIQNATEQNEGHDAFQAPLDVMEGTEQEKTENSVRSNAIFLTGVDELHTRDIETYMVKLYNKPFQIEWIDDSSLNIVYDDPEEAFQSLVAMTHPDEFETVEPIPANHLRLLKPMPEKPEVSLKARYANDSDRKQNGSRAKSRYYLFHGEPTREEDLVRFGTKRTSNPMKYGIKGRDIAKDLIKKPRSGDLFPEKAPESIEDDDLMGDLLPHLAKKPRKRGGKRHRNRNLPDLFAGKIGASGESGPKKASDESAKDVPSVYQNMDY